MACVLFAFGKEEAVCLLRIDKGEGVHLTSTDWQRGSGGKGKGKAEAGFAEDSV